MDEYLEAQLKCDYPDLYREGSYLGCPNGWYSLVDAMSSVLQSNPNVSDGLVIDQLKQKYGKLKIGAEPPGHKRSDVANGIFAFAREVSTNICEVCGTTQNVEIYGGRYVESLCPYCADES